MYLRIKFINVVCDRVKKEKVKDVYPFFQEDEIFSFLMNK